MKFKLFRTSRPVIPCFEVLKKSPIRDHYFCRAAQWRWLNRDMITVIDSHASRVFTMDPWPQLIFLAANGKLTITEYVSHLAGKYKKEIPSDLDNTVLSMIELLLKDKIIGLSTVPREPDPANNLPIK
jgi:hypothetical protein